MKAIVTGFFFMTLYGTMMPAVAEEKSSDWRLIWSDDFNSGTKPDEKSWKIIRGDGCPAKCGFGNNEKQTYTASKKNLRLEDSKLIIEARRGRGNYTSAKITTENQPGWTYGRIIARAKLPAGIGTWPAIWMMPDDDNYGAWPKSGEIDIMEHVGFNQGHVHGTIHTEAYNHRLNTHKGKDTRLETASTEFHTYMVEWTKDSITWSVDDKPYFAVTRVATDTYKEWPFDKPFHLIINQAVGGDWGGREGVDINAYPARLEVDWVQVWQQP